MSNSEKNILKPLHLPTLRGRMGDWIYYVTILKFEDVAERVSMAFEIHKSRKLSEWIQRQLTNRTSDITAYLESQEQRFFNSLILGIYGGKPSWQEIEIKDSPDVYDEESIDYLDRTFGVLTLNGDEKIFPIDGQHRTKAIKAALQKRDKPELAKDEVTAIFVAHKNSPEGEERTRRLFTTLNRYAKPVSKSEIIALDEDDNCAILTRMLVDDFDLLKGRILFSKSKSISPQKVGIFTNIIVIYDSLITLLTDRRVANVKVGGEPFRDFTKKRVSEEKLSEKREFLENLFLKITSIIPSLHDYFYEGKEVDRGDLSSSLLFRPIGQNVFFNVLKVALDRDILDDAINFFAENDFSLGNPVWNKVFWNEEVSNINTNKTLQNYATQLILKKLGVHFNITPTYQEIFDNYGIVEEDLS